MVWKKSIQLAAIFVGSVVGAGFATGREIVEFFSRYGASGMVGILIAGIGFIYFGVKIMLLAIRLEARNFSQLNRQIFGPVFSPIVDLIMFIMLLGVSVVMLSGSGSVFQEQLHWPKEVGIFLTIFLSLIVLVRGTKGLVFVNMAVVPMIMFCTFLLAGKSFFLPDFFAKVFDGGKFEGRVILSALAYVSFNITLTMAVLVPAATDIGDRRAVRLGGIMGGGILTVVLLASHVTLVQLDDLTMYQIPMAMIMKNLASFLYLFFILVIYGEIFTSIIGNIYGVERFVKKFVTVSPLWVGIILFSVIYGFSKMDYGDLLSTLYPLFGYMSIIFLVLLLFQREPKRRGRTRHK